MTTQRSKYEARLAVTAQDLRAAQRLRYRVFVEELGGDGPMVDHAQRLERDEFDPVCDHLLLTDPTRGGEDGVVAVYRLLTSDKAAAFGRFYCDQEYDLTPLRNSGRRLLELGRSCVAPEARGGAAMLLLWDALAQYVLDRRIEVLFGVASFHGVDVGALAQPLAWLARWHLAPEAMRPRARPEGYAPMALPPGETLDRARALAAMPNLIKAYLRLGGFVGEGAFVDRPFNTTDILLLMDTAQMSRAHMAHYARRRGGGAA